MDFNDAREIAKRYASASDEFASAISIDPKWEPHSWVIKAVMEAAVTVPASSMFFGVKNMNDAFGNFEGDPHEIDWPRLRRQLSNVGKELNEFEEAASKQDLEGSRDAICDIMVFALGGYHFMGLSADDDMRAVLEGVMTRFCRTEMDLEATRAKYDELGITYDVHGSFPMVYLKSNKDQGDGEYPLGKFMKSSSYRVAILPPLPNKHATTTDNMRREREQAERMRVARTAMIEDKVATYRAELEREFAGD